VDGVGDEVAPALRDALESVDGPDGGASEDLQDGVFWEERQRHRRRAPLGVRAVHVSETDELGVRV